MTGSGQDRPVRLASGPPVDQSSTMGGTLAQRAAHGSARVSSGSDGLPNVPQRGGAFPLRAPPPPPPLSKRAAHAPAHSSPRGPMFGCAIAAKMAHLGRLRPSNRHGRDCGGVRSACPQLQCARRGTTANVGVRTDHPFSDRVSEWVCQLLEHWKRLHCEENGVTLPVSQVIGGFDDIVFPCRDGYDLYPLLNGDSDGAQRVLAASSGGVAAAPSTLFASPGFSGLRDISVSVTFSRLKRVMAGPVSEKRGGNCATVCLSRALCIVPRSAVAGADADAARWAGHVKDACMLHGKCVALGHLLDIKHAVVVMFCAGEAAHACFMAMKRGGMVRDVPVDVASVSECLMDMPFVGATAAWTENDTTETGSTSSRSNMYETLNEEAFSHGRMSSAAGGARAVPMQRTQASPKALMERARRAHPLPLAAAAVLHLKGWMAMHRGCGSPLDASNADVQRQTLKTLCDTTAIYAVNRGLTDLGGLGQLGLLYDDAQRTSREQDKTRGYRIAMESLCASISNALGSIAAASTNKRELDFLRELIALDVQCLHASAHDNASPFAGTPDVVAMKHAQSAYFDWLLCMLTVHAWALSRVPPGHAPPQHEASLQQCHADIVRVGCEQATEIDERCQRAAVRHARVMMPLLTSTITESFKVEASLVTEQLKAGQTLAASTVFAQMLSHDT